MGPRNLHFTGPPGEATTCWCLRITALGVIYIHLRSTLANQAVLNRKTNPLIPYNTGGHIWAFPISKGGQFRKQLCTLNICVFLYHYKWSLQKQIQTVIKKQKPKQITGSNKATCAQVKQMTDYLGTRRCSVFTTLVYVCITVWKTKISKTALRFYRSSQKLHTKIFRKRKEKYLNHM